MRRAYSFRLLLVVALLPLPALFLSANISAFPVLVDHPFYEWLHQLEELPDNLKVDIELIQRHSPIGRETLRQIKQGIIHTGPAALPERLLVRLYDYPPEIIKLTNNQGTDNETTIYIFEGVPPVGERIQRGLIYVFFRKPRIVAPHTACCCEQLESYARLDKKKGPEDTMTVCIGFGPHHELTSEWYEEIVNIFRTSQRNYDVKALKQKMKTAKQKAKRVNRNKIEPTPDV